MMDEYSDEKYDEILKLCHDWIIEFLNSDFCKGLTQEELIHSAFIIESFIDYMYGYFLLTPEECDENTVEEICLGLFPRKVTAELSCFKAVGPVLTNFFAFLNHKGVINNALILSMKLREIQDKIVKAASNHDNWGMAKIMMMDAIETGVDVENENELNKFCQFRNLIQDLNMLTNIHSFKTRKIGRKNHAHAEAIKNIKNVVSILTIF